MRSDSWERVVESLDDLDAAIDDVLGLGFEVLGTAQRLEVLERLETAARRLPVPGHELVNELGRQATPVELGGSLSQALADRLRITRTEAGRRIRTAAELGPRQSLTGEDLAPVLAGSAAAQRDGQIGDDHIAVIARFCRRLPGFVDAPTRTSAEAHLAGEATRFRPEQLRGLAHALANCLNPDGDFSDNDRARARGLTLGSQGADGMSKLTGYLDPLLRATLEAVLAKLAAPGMNNPADQQPVTGGSAPQESIDADTRTRAQRNHDGLQAGLQALLASGELGTHNGLPASVIVTTTLAELHAAAGYAYTGGGSTLPLPELIALAASTRPYLAIFDGATPLALYHTNRLASPAQRLMLYATDRGCTHPGCDVPGYHCEVHHTIEYAHSGHTHIDELTFACGPHHRLVSPTGWHTHKNRRNTTEWHPPPHLDRQQPRINTFHHPEKLLHNDDDDDDP